MRVIGLTGAAAIVLIGCSGGGDGGTPPPPPPTVTSVVVTPSAAQSMQACGTVNFTAQATNSQGQAVSGAPINWSATGQAVSLSSNSGTSTTATGVALGSSDITARSGTVTSSPAVTVTVTAGGASGSAAVSATTSNTFSPNCVTISAGGSVTWSFAALHNVTFTGSAPTGGGIGDMSAGSASRTFPNPGSYPYTCTLHGGMNGRVVVQ